MAPQAGVGLEHNHIHEMDVLNYWSSQSLPAIVYFPCAVPELKGIDAPLKRKDEIRFSVLS